MKTEKLRPRDQSVGESFSIIEEADSFIMDSSARKGDPTCAQRC